MPEPVLQRKVLGKVFVFEEVKIYDSLPMNADTLYRVRPKENVKPADLYKKMYKGWKDGKYYPMGTCQNFIKKSDIEEVAGVDAVVTSEAKDLQKGDILIQRVSGTECIVGKPFFVMKKEPLQIVVIDSKPIKGSGLLNITYTEGSGIEELIEGL